jgi:hypothetical protein
MMKDGILDSSFHEDRVVWIPACAGMTELEMEDNVLSIKTCRLVAGIAKDMKYNSKFWIATPQAARNDSKINYHTDFIGSQ